MTDTFSRSLFRLNETSTISWIIKSQVKCTNSDKIWTHLVLSWASESLNGFPCGILWILISEWNNKWRIKKGMWKILRSRATGWQKIDKKNLQIEPLTVWNTRQMLYVKQSLRHSMQLGNVLHLFPEPCIFSDTIWMIEISLETII